jgi:polysaccharide pyruvyl transferase WcaK-like protein
MALKGTDVFIVPGTGLLTDAYGLTNWGPYSTFKWSLIAKMRGCRLLFVSVGAGPIYSSIGRFFVKAALSLADFRSYRDVSTQRYLKSIGFPADRDPVYPDLVFSLPAIPGGHDTNVSRPVVGLGLMGYVGRYSAVKPSTSTYRNYLEGLVILVNWLLARGYDLRLLIGDIGDQGMTQEFRTLLKKRSVADDGDRIIDEPIASVEDLLSQLAATDFVVATRFHNVLLALLLNKPVVAISFHHKCSSLMSQMGLADYCLDINHLQADELISQFCRLEANETSLKAAMAEQVRGCREALDEQYALMLRTMWPERDRSTVPASAMEVRPSPGSHMRP